ncbi:TELO2-interacting protein 2 [Elgaria multicarinata webbii]|uniref:TELO2-interacting protein 2 n=1 Tax=Elgaria multicarinata webbii TaxID=159646 RepID=UPI002FCCEF55
MELHPLLGSLQLTVPEGQGCFDCPPVDQVLPQFLRLFACGGPQGTGSNAEAGMTRDLLAILEAVGCQWLFGGGCQNAAPKLLRDLAVALCHYAAPLQQEPEEGDAGSPYAAVADRAEDAGLVLCNVVAKVEAAKGLGSAAVGSALRQLAGPAFVFAVTHVADTPWSKARSRSLAQELLDGLLRASDCRSVPEFLRGAREGEDGWFAAVMQCLKPELTKETWQRNPATKHVFSSMLLQVTRPWLSQHLEKVLPPSLLLSDDYRVENKILGVQCLHHIIRNVPAADLCHFNRAQVVYHALSHHLYSKEAQLMQVVLPCLLDLLPILERAPQRLAAPSDEVLRLVLTHMETEHRLSLRRVYARSLPAFVERLGIQVARHLKRLQQVIVGYLEVSDGPEEAARLATLETLKRTIQHAWPRMTCRLTVLLKALLRMMWDVVTDSSSTPEPVKNALLQRATECLLLLDHSSHGQVKVLLQGVLRSCQDEHLKEYLQKVQEEPTKSLSPPELKKEI